MTPEQARLQLFDACDDVRASGSGIRNATLNRRAQWIGRLIGSGLLAEREALEELKRAGRDAGLSATEISATLSSAIRSGKAKPIEPQKPETRVESTPQSRFIPIAEWLLSRCAVGLQLEVMNTLRARRLDGYTTDLLALPPAPMQQRLIGELVEEFGRADFQHSGLAHLLPSGELDVTRFAWPEHRLGIVWRDIDGDPQTIERRHVGSTPSDKRWVFPRGRAPMWPLGYDQLARADKSRPVIIVEGPTDCLALRLWVASKSPMPVVVALPSATKLRAEWIPALVGRTVHVALDMDKAGEEAATAIVAQLRGVTREPCIVLRTTAPAGSKDWAEAWQKRGARG